MKNKFALFTTVTALAGAVLLTSVNAWSQDGAPPQPAAPTPGAHEHHEKHPAIHAAIAALERAKVDLKKADHDFGGHRVTALKECDAAIAELREALKYDKK